MTQGVIPFQYEEDPARADLTAFAGLMLYLDLFAASALRESIEQHLGFLDGEQGWTAYELLTSLALLNLAGGDGVNDIEILEQDTGFAEVFRRFRVDGLNRRQRRALKARWRKERTRAFPSPSAIHRFLSEFHNEAQEELREEGKAFIPAPNKALRGLQRVCDDMVAFVQRSQPQRTATLDMDATLDETHKRNALHCYKGFKAYQPLNVWWAEQQLIVRSEFRDGNVPEWTAKRMKAVRFSLLHVAGRVVAHARQLFVRLRAGPALGLMLEARRRLLALAGAPSG